MFLIFLCVTYSFSWVPTLTDSDSEEESDSSFEVPQTKRRKPKKNGPRRGRKVQQRGRPNSASSDEYGRKGKGRGKKTYNGPKRGATTSAIRFKHISFL